jgi:hypothetical protein
MKAVSLFDQVLGFGLDFVVGLVWTTIFTALALGAGAGMCALLARWEAPGLSMLSAGVTVAVMIDVVIRYAHGQRSFSKFLRPWQGASVMFFVPLWLAAGLAGAVLLITLFWPAGLCALGGLGAFVVHCYKA